MEMIYFEVYLKMELLLILTTNVTKSIMATMIISFAYVKKRMKNLCIEHWR